MNVCHTRITPGSISGQLSLHTVIAVIKSKQSVNSAPTQLKKDKRKETNKKENTHISFIIV